MKSIAVLSLTATRRATTAARAAANEISCLNRIAWETFQPEESAKLLKNTPTGQESKNGFIRIFFVIKSLFI